MTQTSNPTFSVSAAKTRTWYGGRGRGLLAYCIDGRHAAPADWSGGATNYQRRQSQRATCLESGSDEKIHSEEHFNSCNHIFLLKLAPMILGRLYHCAYERCKQFPSSRWLSKPRITADLP
jgi:hypothetical protein